VFDKREYHSACEGDYSESGGGKMIESELDGDIFRSPFGEEPEGL